MLSANDLKRFHSGKLFDAYRKFGAQLSSSGGQSGVAFATWAPHASAVSVIGDFNDWDGRIHPMERADSGGVWSAFVPGLAPGAQYKFEIHNAANGKLVIKTDPYGKAFPAPANTNALVSAESAYAWGDDAWVARRRGHRWRDEPFNMYEVHLGSWRRRADGSYLSYEELAEQLTAYALDLHFTHLELLPVYEHPLDESLGYQVTGYFAPTSRFGTPDQFRAFVDRCHQAGVGVVLDWVPLHFPKDFWALAEFDGEPLYELDDPNMREHPRWRTLIFNYGRPEVRNFLLSNALYWLQEFHADGLRVDAVSSMLYLDDARTGGTWTANPLGGRENLAAVRFLREMNAKIASVGNGVVTIAEESSSWPSVSQPATRGGLGFSMKWNMGWVHDTLTYLNLPWQERPAHHRDLTFERLYAKAERFVLALSHDEVFASRGSLCDQMYGDADQKLAGLRTLLLYQMTYPGKKLTFMGNEFASTGGWTPITQLDWHLSRDHAHASITQLVRDLGKLYEETVALHAGDFDSAAFRWINADDADRCVIAFMRAAPPARKSTSVAASSSFSQLDDIAVVLLNFSNQGYDDFRLGVPCVGGYAVLLDSDAQQYGGGSRTRLIRGLSEAIPSHGFAQSLRIALPALTGLIIASAS